MSAAKRAADSTLYHLSPKGFWKKFRDAVVVNPEISSGLPIQGINRYPPPGSRPERYSTPATKASDPAQNPYWKRDVRRTYPRLSVVTQTELSALLIDHAQAPSYVPTSSQSPQSPNVLIILGEQASVPAASKQPVDLTAAIATVTSAAKAYSESHLPPTLPIAYKPWVPERAPDAPHDPNAYFPMRLIK
ncbi:21 kDa subunit of NADH dehydrogenase [Cristinia sonorae]|uniref:21 kDa subunit of NADH dehydrogenase n=1 Tax=Cristinia sonorae TaxID=1940300 RepID=A0A8K0XKQ8_9AGAR|nr:21 kDa subunit of NADH dehydrogenase [Cristinia sonorae]